MNISDIDPAGHGERLQNFGEQLGAFDGNKPMSERVQLYEMAWQRATAEMLDEIHAMLRVLTHEHRGEEYERNRAK